MFCRIACRVKTHNQLIVVRNKNKKQNFSEIIIEKTKISLNRPFSKMRTTRFEQKNILLFFYGRESKNKLTNEILPVAS